MKKLLLIVGIVIIVACVICLLYGALNMFAYRGVLDGSAELYIKLHRRMNVSFIGGGVLAVLGVLCFMIRSRL